MTRHDVLHDLHTACQLADRMLELGIDPQRVHDWLETATKFYRRCLDQLEGVGR